MKKNNFKSNTEGIALIITLYFLLASAFFIFSLSGGGRDLVPIRSYPRVRGPVIESCYAWYFMALSRGHAKLDS